jgi:ATP-dependent helicase/nuclease subunit A
MNTIPQNIAERQTRASHPQFSAWVSANAGAGKTHVLVNRFLRLMLTGCAPSRILCLTYTKAAAVEMEKRLFAKLADWASLNETLLSEAIIELGETPPDSERLDQTRQLFAHALNTPGGLKIGTIHAFCENLLHRFPREAGLPPHFSVMDEPMAAQLLGQARDEILTQGSAGEDRALRRALAFLVARTDEAALDRLITALVAHRRYLGPLSSGAKTAEEVIRELEAALELKPGESEEEIRSQAFAVQNFPEAELRFAQALLSEGRTSDQTQAQRLARLFATRAAGDTKNAYAIYLEFFATQDGDERKQFMTKSLREAQPELDAVLRREAVRLLALEERRRNAMLAEASGALAIFAARLMQAYSRLKRRRNLLDYDDLIERSITLLTGAQAAAWVLYKLDGGLDHVLIDEAQDTTPAQWQVIRALTEEFFAGEGAHEEHVATPRSIFAVGDEKQSIYSFNGADPAGFEHMRSYFSARVREAGGRFESLSLTLSFRSTQAVLDAVDAVFGLEQARAGLTAAGEDIAHIARRAKEAGLAALWPCIIPQEIRETEPWHAPLDHIDAQSPTVTLANHLAGIIANWLQSPEILSSTGKPICAGDILILVRRRNAFMEEMISALKRRGIPVAGADRMILAEQIVVRDLVAMGQFALLPQDDLNLASLLKSPLIGLEEEELFHLAHGRTGTLFESLLRHAPSQARFEVVRRLLADVSARADTMPVFEFFSHILENLGGRRRIAAYQGPQAFEAIDEFFNQALIYEQSAAPSLQGFLHWFTVGQAEVKRDLDHGRDEIRVMTAHGAKGLEAPIVILPDTCQIPEGRQDDVVLAWYPQNRQSWAERSPFLLWRDGREKPAQAVISARGYAAQLREAEYRRLLYVAMTRARDRLYICGYENKRPSKGDTWYSLARKAFGKHGKKVDSPFGEEAFQLQSGRLTARADIIAPIKPKPSPSWIDKLPPEEKIPALVLPSKAILPGLRLGEDSEGAMAAIANDETALRLRRGQLIHRLLELLPARDETLRAAAAERFLEFSAPEFDPAARQEICASVLRILAHDEFEPLFSSGSRAEIMLAGRLDLGAGTLVNVAGRVDRLAMKAEELLLVDYKSNRPVPSSPEEVQPAYVTQMALYRALLREMLPSHKIRCLLLWTEAPQLMELPDLLLDKALMRAS